jgi:hypothetical protein
MKLPKWTYEQKLEVAHFLAQGYTLRRCCERAFEELEDLYPYSLERVRVWARSEEGSEIVGQALSIIRERLGKRPWTQEESRVDALITVAGEIFTTLMQLDKKKDTGKFVSLSAEFRQYMEAVRKERAPFAESEVDTLSLIERWASIKKKAEKEGFWDETSIS